MFGRKGEVKKKWGVGGGLCLEMEGCHVILRFLWRFLMMQHRKKNIDLSFVNKRLLQKNAPTKV